MPDRKIRLVHSAPKPAEMVRDTAALPDDQEAYARLAAYARTLRFPAEFRALARALEQSRFAQVAPFTDLIREMKETGDDWPM